MTYQKTEINNTFKNAHNSIKKQPAEQGVFSSLDNIETTATLKSGLEPSICKGSSDFSRVETFEEKEDKITSFFKNKPAYTDHQELELIHNKGEILQDPKFNWRDYKLKSQAVSYVLEHEKRSERMALCGGFLTFGINSFNEKKLINATFCKDRMCPACQKRRSLTIFHQLINICGAIVEDMPNSRFLFLTLTVPNVKFIDLDATIKHLMASFKRLTNRAIFKKLIKGFFRALEITYNKERDDYHPHFHILLCVNSNYFTKNYITQGQWLEMWQQATKNPYITQVDIRVVKENKKRKSDAIASASAEVGKYATKPSDYLKKGVGGLYIADFKVVNELMLILKNKRLVAYGGILKEYFNKLNCSDVNDDDVDLVNVDDKEEFKALKQQVFKWNVGFNNYESM